MTCGGRDNIDLMLVTDDGVSRHYPKINGGERWAPGTWPRAYVVLDPPVAYESITELDLIATVTGGIDGDNIDIDSIVITGRGGARNWPVATVGAGAFHRHLSAAHDPGRSPDPRAHHRDERRRPARWQ